MTEPQERTGQARGPHPRAHLAHNQWWMQCPRPNADAGLRLVCVPYSGGRASAFTGLAAELPDDIELLAVELPGHGRRLGEPPLTRLRPLVDQLTDILADVREPYMLLGYSVGALISFEVTRELVRHGWPGPRALFVAAARAPHRRSTRPPLHQLSRAELVEGLHRLAGHRNELLDNEELVDLMLPVLRADLGLDETYTPPEGDPLDCPIAAFGGSEDWSVSRSDLEGWREQTTGDFSATVLPGGHFFLDSSRGLFAEALSTEIERLKQRPRKGSAP
jgi:medium-chain acyl-[acyl-carrier-protein] hydrolase